MIKSRCGFFITTFFYPDHAPTTSLNTILAIIASQHTIMKVISMDYELKDEYIELYKLIKLLDLVDSGAEAKIIVEGEHVYRNGELETRKRAKIRKGEKLVIGDVSINVI
jgi:ribosome-associated protein